MTEPMLYRIVNLTEKYSGRHRSWSQSTMLEHLAGTKSYLLPYIWQLTLPDGILNHEAAFAMSQIVPGLKNIREITFSPECSTENSLLMSLEERYPNLHIYLDCNLLNRAPKGVDHSTLQPVSLLNKAFSPFIFLMPCFFHCHRAELFNFNLTLSAKHTRRFSYMMALMTTSKSFL